MNESPSGQVIGQRVINRIIEVLELFPDPNAFDVAVSNLVFWADGVDKQRIEMFRLPVFSGDEVSEIEKVDLAWESVHLDSLKNSIQWIKFPQVATSALKLYLLRGRFSEKVENA